MATARAVTSNSIYWLALSLTPGLGPTRGRKLVERFASIQDIFHASLTELEAENLQAQSAQHIALGKSLELAHDESAKAVAAGVQILCREDAPGRRGSARSTIPRWCCTSAEMRRRWRVRASPLWARAIRRRMAWAWRSD